MPHPNFVILYVDSPEASARFYAALLDTEPVESSPTFALFALASGLRLGLWSKRTVEPAPGGEGGGCELSINVDTHAEVDAACARWTERGVPLLMPPRTLEFGRSFVAVDPDGHRLRVFSPA
ncbi:drug:proton antiporter [Pigmentiphaga sp. NML080357]|jgi:predicted enzyme related to lactoylglutathione lyase|uniref:VOC family protein n=1 Tax=Pigmentiphaga sp. NML080357 TaxID=2008675 RepID=UPI000B408B04|nr:VOC family protein [Pigmentiphaga sp. NML080357]OVZ60681.1 drug:proton antiporter [Pigmentiphaga sp. NML080357]